MQSPNIIDSNQARNTFIVLCQRASLSPDQIDEIEVMILENAYKSALSNILIIFANQISIDESLVLKSKMNLVSNEKTSHEEKVAKLKSLVLETLGEQKVANKIQDVIDRFVTREYESVCQLLE